MPALSPRARRALLLVSLAAAAGCATVSRFTHRSPAGPGPASPDPTPPDEPLAVDRARTPAPPPSPLAAAPPLSCPTPGGTKEAKAQGNPRARRGAERGLAFVAREATNWQEGHKCYGCHVQAVTMEALAIGKHNQYDVSPRDLATMVAGLTTINGGSRGPNGLSVEGSPIHLIETSKEFGGAAFARYDALVGPELRGDLIKTAEELTAYQDADGSLRTSDRRFPVETGPMQATTQAMQTWRQAFERTADEKWLAPLRKAEGWLQGRARRLAEDREATIVDLNYAAIGLASAGAQASEGTVKAIAERLRSLARPDGGFAFTPQAEPGAFATGQTLYALRLLGGVDEDPVISRGTSWLLEHQAEDGGWSHGGAGKAEAMWAVLGLVSVDVLSIAVGGVEDGQHGSGTLGLRVRASDNAGRGVARVEVAVDDVTVHRACGGALEYGLDTGRLAAGAHFVDVTAVNARGQESRRRVQIYTGAYYLTELGTRFSDGGTVISLRDVAPPRIHGQVVLRVFSTREEGGRPVRVSRVHEETRPSAEGPLSFFWKGADAHGRFLAEVSFVDEPGHAVQTVEAPFVHDTLEHQHAAFGEVEGSLTVNGAAPAANTTVDLVDEQGRVVQSAQTNNSGNYRFRNIDGGKYKVRVSRPGFHAAEADVSAARGAPAAAAPAMNLF
jgi:Carboxypeptidase regulatory-like domain